MVILLKDIWSIDNPQDYKIHFARQNDKKVEPLDVWVKNNSDWQEWQESRPKKNDFNRPFIFSLMRFYPETDIWLFGGVFEVLDRHSKPPSYEVRLTNLGEEFIGRLKIHYVHKNRVTRAKMNPYYEKFEVREILRKPYSGETFPGYDSINLSFGELEVLIKNSRPDWKAALGNIKGVYLITDVKKNKRYVGSASSDGGVWARWAEYIKTGDGGNPSIREHVDGAKRGNQTKMDYCKSSFRFSLLEQFSTTTFTEKILEREGYWKDILLTRGGIQGINRN